MRKGAKIIIAGVIIGFLWGAVQIPFSFLGLMECRGRGFLEILYDYTLLGLLAGDIDFGLLIKRPIALLFSLIGLPVIISLAIVCSTNFEGNIGLMYLSSIVLTMLFSILFGIIGSLVFVGLTKFFK